MNKLTNFLALTGVKIINAGLRRAARVLGVPPLEGVHTPAAYDDADADPGVARPLAHDTLDFLRDSQWDDVIVIGVYRSRDPDDGRAPIYADVVVSPRPAYIPPGMRDAVVSAVFQYVDGVASRECKP